MRIALLTLLSVWIVSSLAGTVAESRTTWLLFALIALADRVAGDEAEVLSSTFSPLESSSALNGYPDVVL